MENNNERSDLNEGQNKHTESNREKNQQNTPKDGSQNVRERKKFFKPKFKELKEGNSEETEGANTTQKRWKNRQDSKAPRENRGYKENYEERTKPTKDKESKSGDARDFNKNNQKGNFGFKKDLKKGVETNTRAQKSSLNPHYKLNLGTKASVRITPLGGLGEIGGNMTVFETENSAIVIDVGMSFPDENMPGVNILVPDFSYLQTIKHKIKGVIITHAHEDHIGAVPYLYKLMQFPLYGTPLALGLISNKFDEHGLKKCRDLCHVVEKRKPVQVGDFEIEWIHITHSIIDASALAITTEAGTILHTGDFKIDHTPIDNLPTDLHRLAYYGERGVMLMLSDSTNSHKPGVTPSEASIGPAFDHLFQSAKGRVIMSTFSSNIHRVYQAILHGIKYGRKVAVIGMSMEKNLDLARELGYIDLPNDIFIDAHKVNSLPDNEVLIVTTGSQGEPMSALYRMATNDHRHINIKGDDLIILSAKAIPGNEGSVSSILNLLMKAGARVAYQDFSEIHVSGHAAQEEQKLMLRLVKPKFFLPVHGEYNHIARHKQTAISCGVLEKNIILMEDGDQIEVNPNYMRTVKHVKTGKGFIDNNTNKYIDSEVVSERNALSKDGIFILTLRFDNLNKEVLSHKINVFGILNQKDEVAFGEECFEALLAHINVIKPFVLKDSKAFEADLFSFFRKLLFKKFKKYPAILINAFFTNETPAKPKEHVREQHKKLSKAEVIESKEEKEGFEVEKDEKSQRPERSERPERHERAERSERGEKTPRPERPERAERAEKSQEKGERSEKRSHTHEELLDVFNKD
ncbi:ribonuclease J [Helicobacter sp. 13S00401-1]|uniref:ribonuclease J n=1 Tax=Helicobacter sp. 13S00401-1 TaxID=1905758 RepID=UPI000BA71085|nr:ribonuclease J [Helicobacter sp. 13S00401-1]PAF49659.1 ribonuclease J [Helicobacter sp. 13S00401-1]